MRWVTGDRTASFREENSCLQCGDWKLNSGRESEERPGICCGLPEDPFFSGLVLSNRGADSMFSSSVCNDPAVFVFCWILMIFRWNLCQHHHCRAIRLRANKLVSDASRQHFRKLKKVCSKPAAVWSSEYLRIVSKIWLDWIEILGLSPHFVELCHKLRLWHELPLLLSEELTTAAVHIYVQKRSREAATFQPISGTLPSSYNPIRLQDSVAYCSEEETGNYVGILENNLFTQLLCAF